MKRRAARFLAAVLLAAACGPDTAGTQDEDPSDNIYPMDIVTCLPACEANKCLLGPEDEGCNGACIEFAESVDPLNPTECDSAKVASNQCMVDAFWPGWPDSNETASCAAFEQAQMSSSVELCQAERDLETAACGS